MVGLMGVLALPPQRSKHSLLLCGGSWATSGCLKHLCLTTDQDMSAVLCVGSAEWATVLFVIQLSIGESIWSPRWYDYSMSVAPEGREGVFTAMASAPLFLGKFVTGKSQSDCVRVSCTLRTKTIEAVLHLLQTAIY